MALDNTITRYPGGVTNSYDNSPLSNLKVSNRGIYHEFSDDFDKYTAAQWAVGGIGTPVAPLLVAGDGGLLQLTTSAASGDNNWIQQLVAAWTLSAAKRLFLSARVTVDVASLTALVVGLQPAVAANVILTPADGLFIRKAAAETFFTLEHRVGGVAITSAGFGVSADATQVELSLAIDGQNVVAGLNGVNQASITVPVYTAVPLKLTVGVSNGTAALRNLALDQLVCLKAR